MTAIRNLMCVEDACEYLGVSRYFVYDQVRLGRLPCARIARQLRFRPADVEGFVEAHFLGAAQQPTRTAVTALRGVSGGR
jgi:excisionase family DNA binding protein